MKNSMTFQLNNPLSIVCKGSGEFVKKECANLVKTFEEAEDNHLQDIIDDGE